MNTRYIFGGAATVIAILGACSGDPLKRKESPSYCDVVCACEGCDDVTLVNCYIRIDDLEMLADNAGCKREFNELVECAASDGVCLLGHYDLSNVCEGEAQAFDACGGYGDTCSTADDGVCDEPEGTDTCPEGTDVNDCSIPCSTTNDGICDEPGGTGACPAGTDVEDCGLSPCPYTNNGVCDEPEGTGICAEWTDSSDCMVQVCESNGDCNLCQQCALEGPCSDERLTCQSNVDCDYAATCIEDCEDACGIDPDPGACEDICVNGTGGCASVYPTGIALWNALISCVFTQECPVSCDGAW